MKRGFVSLVGAGPGDPGLLTVKALSRIREADLIIYDYLVNPEHLTHAKKSCALVPVGKGFRHKLMSQKRINRRILSEAAKGKNVVRLKGGDPYLFGRGAEEALFLVENRVPFESVPGVTSATACAAYAGIPLTHRNHNASVTFLTGHRADDGSLDSIDWRRIAAMPGTLVIYMGFYHLALIAQKLTQSGMGADTPVAVIEWGTLPRQRTVTGTLADIAEKVRAAKLAPPCLIVIGEVVALSEKLDWYQRLPLFGKKVLVTRMREKAGQLSERLRALGADAQELPALEILPLSDTRALDRALRGLILFDWVVFTSAFGVEAFFRRLSALGRDSRSLCVRTACVGPGTAQALREHGIEPDAVPARFETSALPGAIRKKAGSLRGLRMLLVRTDIAPPQLERLLKKEGVRVERVTGYRTRRAKPAPGTVMTLLSVPPDYLTFASASAVHGLAGLLGKARFKKLASRSTVVSIGPITSRALRALGVRPACQASRYDLDGLIGALTRHAEVRA